MSQKVLIVEDDLILSCILKEIFQLKGWSTETAISGKEALVLVETYNPDVILSDINMPVMGGLEMLESLYLKECMTPVVFLSGFRDAEKMTTAWRLCAYDFLDKPFEKEKVLMVCDAAAVYGKDYVVSARKRNKKIVKA